ncbi:hypothetical protein FGO68_gene16967 [Halteria grandinella]|uniref:MutL C-terminal dimerisation domain-containing protein n=1 Tax=Halteria grandinella TaxID=5974 RepID=A0A8J8T3F4_HALGN|nr:hypothetical protein FGO68_gene16967 [Halteria grandinella]
MHLLFIKDVYEGQFTTSLKHLPNLIILSLPSSSSDLVQHVLSEFIKRTKLGFKSEKYSKIVRDQEMELEQRFDDALDIVAGDFEEDIIEQVTPKDSQQVQYNLHQTKQHAKCSRVSPFIRKVGLRERPKMIEQEVPYSITPQKQKQSTVTFDAILSMKRSEKRIRATQPLKPQPVHRERCHQIYQDISRIEEVFKQSVNLNIKDLSRLELLNQIDETFLLGRLDRMIIALDQHAMHERINLEQLEKLYKDRASQIVEREENLMKFESFIASHLPLERMRVNEEIDLGRRFKLLLVMKDQRDYFYQHGWKYRIDGEWILIDEIPVVFGHKFTPELLLHQVESSKGLITTKPKIPPYAHEVLKMKACRYAVKFGQKLNLDLEAMKLVEHLKSCKRPFICAHGRPTVYVLGSF